MILVIELRKKNIGKTTSGIIMRFFWLWKKFYDIIQRWSKQKCPKTWNPLLDWTISIHLYFVNFFLRPDYKDQLFISILIDFSGSRILGVTVSKEQMYPMKLKGISICFSMLKAALCGSYVNFGVFRLYGDDALDNALNSFVKLLLSIPQSDLLVSLKLFFDREQRSKVLKEALLLLVFLFLAWKHE